MEFTPRLPPATVAKRILAFAVDLALMGGVFNCLLIIAVLGAFALGFDLATLENLQTSALFREPRAILLLLLGLLTLFLSVACLWHSYFIYFEYRYRATPGKRLLGLRVVSRDGQPLSLSQCGLREVFRSYVDLPFILPGIGMILFSAKHQRLGDKVTGTLVVHDARLERNAAAVYLSAEDFARCKLQYQVRPVNQGEARAFLQAVAPLLRGPLGAATEQNGLDFFSQVTRLTGSDADDSAEMKLRYLAEYLLELENR